MTTQKGKHAFTTAHISKNIVAELIDDRLKYVIFNFDTQIFIFCKHLTDLLYSVSSTCTNSKCKSQNQVSYYFYDGSIVISSSGRNLLNCCSTILRYLYLYVICIIHCFKLIDYSKKKKKTVSQSEK